MISNRFRVILLGIIPVIIIAGCKKFVEIAPPTTELVTTNVFNNPASATAAQLSIYIQMASNDESGQISQNSGILADELTSYSTEPEQQELYTNSLLSSDDVGRWLNGYKYIYQANAIITALQNNKSIAPSIVQQLTGESKFIRAFWHLYLTNMYGDIPLVLTTDYTINDKIARTPRADVYAQIIKDLNDAAGELNSNYVDATDTAATSQRIRPTKWAAYAMLARAYLYTEKYSLAAAMASQVINNSNFQLCTNLSPAMGPNSVFLMNSSEAIWQLGIPLPANNDTPDAKDFVLTSAPGTGYSLSTTISPQLLNSFEAGDLRKANWIGVYQTGGAQSVNYNFAYKYRNTSTNITEYIMVLRLAEQYLIRAEAEAQLDDLADAVKDLNLIRTRAGLPNTAATSQSDILTAIFHERQVELFAEWGHRWFDLVRTGAVNTVLGSPGNVYQSKGGVGSWNTSKALYPIPLSEILNDPNLTQNPGY